MSNGKDEDDVVIKRVHFSDAFILVYGFLFVAFGLIFDALQAKYWNDRFWWVRVLLNLRSRQCHLIWNWPVWVLWLWICPCYAYNSVVTANVAGAVIWAGFAAGGLMLHRKKILENVKKVRAGRTGGVRPPVGGGVGRVAPAVPPPARVLRPAAKVQVKDEDVEDLEDAVVPDYWTNSRRVSQTENAAFDQMVYVSPGSRGVFTDLLSKTYRPIATQDRPCPKSSDRCKKTPGGCGCVRPGGEPGLPTGYVVRRIIRVEDSGMWKRYCRKRDDIAEKRAGSADMEKIAPPVFTHEVADCNPDTLTPLQDELNEVYLWHGTATRLALSIAQNDFNINLAGSNAGTMYGRGAYLTESCTKADEYASDEPGQYYDGVFALLLVRACLGRFYYTTNREPEAAGKVTSGDYDSVLGDRAASVKTYREFVVYDSDQVYPEFIVLYSRLFKADDEAAVRAGFQVPFHMELPVYWTNCHLNPRQEAFAFQYRVRSGTQALLEELAKSTATGHKGLKVVEAFRLEVSNMWNRYVDFRSSVQARDIPTRVIGSPEGHVKLFQKGSDEDHLRDDDSDYHDYCSLPMLSGQVQMLAFSCNWKEMQDSGNRKGRMRVSLMRGDDKVVVADLFGVCSSNQKTGWKYAHRELTGKDPLVEKAGPGDVLKVEYLVGDGGRELHIKDFKCVTSSLHGDADFLPGKVRIARCKQPNELDGREETGHALTSVILEKLHAEDVISLENLDSTVNEMFLWHGTSQSAANAIISSGFHIPRGEKARHGKRFGEGAYFAEDISKSLSYCSADEAGFSYVLLCRTTCGELFYTEDNSRREAHKDAAAENKDSILANPSNSSAREFIVLRESQVYPEFMLKLKT